MSLISSPLFAPLFIRLFLCLFLSSLSLSSNQSFSYPFFSDENSLLMVLITVFVLFISLVSVNSYSKLSSFTLLALFTLCILVFVSNNVLPLFIFYEASLFPILFIILKWGAYPERRLRAILLLVYTIVFTLPFLYVLFFIFSDFKTLSLSSLYLKPPVSSQLLVLILFLAFSVKLPIYGLHFWLPIAHVEAPTFGSIVLAGVLLKLGGVSLLRLLPLFELSSLRALLLSYSIVFIFYSTLVCCCQSDFKRLIAYSSVSHIIALVPLFVCNADSRFYSALLLILFHGVSSPLLFFLVGISYEMNSTRQLSLLRGLLVLSPLFSLSLSFAFFYTLRAPPLPSFIREVFFIIGSLALSPLFSIPLLLFTFLSLVYNLNWLSTVLFNSSSLTSNFQFLTGKRFLVVFLVLLITILLLGFLLFCFY